MCDKEDNELIVLEMIHHYVECLDRYFGNVCELDIIFNFHKAYFIIEEILAAGYIQESGNYNDNSFILFYSYSSFYHILFLDKKAIMRSLQNQDALLEEEKEEEYNNKK